MLWYYILNKYTWNQLTTLCSAASEQDFGFARATEIDDSANVEKIMNTGQFYFLKCNKCVFAGPIALNSL